MALIEKLTKIGDAIRLKLGTTTKYSLEEMETAILSIPSGGGSGFNYKSWNVTLPSSVSTGTVKFVEGDADVKAHYADNDAVARFIWTGTASELSTSNFVYSQNGNTEIYTGIYGIYAIRGSAAGAVNPVGLANSLKTASSRTGMLAATSSGNISLIAYSSRILPAGDYKVEFYWRES